MTEPTKQQKRERAERRRKLEEFWRWVIGEKPDCFQQQLESLPPLCQHAVGLVMQMRTYADNELERDLSLAQLDVLEMLEERVGERRGSRHQSKGFL